LVAFSEEIDMSTNSKWILATFASGALLVLGQSGAFAGDTSKPGPAKIEKIEGSNVARVILTEAAIGRLGIETTPVHEEVVPPRKSLVSGISALTVAANTDAGSASVTDAGQSLPSPETRKIIPYSAVIYDLAGQSWVYVNTEPRTYVRQPVTIDYSKGQVTVLKDGPAVGTSVVSVGAAELFGAETGVK
jgi:hypothetical protein